MPTAFVCVLLFISQQQAATQRLELDANEWATGLVARYESHGKSAATFTRVEPKPAFFLGDSSPHPRLPQGPFTVTWTGIVHIKDQGPLKFSAFIGGQLRVVIGQETVLDVTEADFKRHVVSSKVLKLPVGWYPIVITFRSTTNVPARVQLWWQGPSFAREPIPAWRFGHILERRPNELQRDEQIEHGRQLSQQHGCGRCHSSAFPHASDRKPGPSLHDLGKRTTQAWIMQQLQAPHHATPHGFTADAKGAAERWLLAKHLVQDQVHSKQAAKGDHRRGRITFVSVGCATCHLVPDIALNDQQPLGRRPFERLADRFDAASLASFLTDPHSRYPDGRMPKLSLNPAEASDIAAFLLLWSKPTTVTAEAAPTPEMLATIRKSLNASDDRTAAQKLLTAKGCQACHSGLGESVPLDHPIRTPLSGCLTEGKHFRLSKKEQEALRLFMENTKGEHPPSPVVQRQRRLEQANCMRCHQRDTERPPAIEAIGSTLGGAHLQEVPFLRTPRLTNPHQKFTRAHLSQTLREGTTGLRWARFSYRMPIYGPAGDDLERALAETDGELPDETDTPDVAPSDPTLGTLHGARLVGFQGYSCVSCHVWNTKLLASTDPGATGPDLARTLGRIRRDWFNRYLEGPARFHPGTPMPTILPHGQKAPLTSILNGDPHQQQEAIWAYLRLGKDAPNPTPPPALPITGDGKSALVALIPVRVDKTAIESLCLLTPQNDLVVYDLGSSSIHRVYVGASILRNVQGRIRQFTATGEEVECTILNQDILPRERNFMYHTRLPNGMELAWRVGTKDYVETILVAPREIRRTIRLLGTTKPLLDVSLSLPPAKASAKWNGVAIPFADDPEGTLDRPGFKATAYPRPKTISGEDRIMPGAIAVRPKDGKLFVASLKTGELFTLQDGPSPVWQNEVHGLFQDALSMYADDDVYLLHRRNLTRIRESKDGSQQFERIAHLPHGIADTYDMAYGLTRDAKGRFVFGYAPYANTTLAGSGGAVRYQPGQPVEELAYGMRNPLGWCRGPQDEIFYTDNQGEWVASNKLGHVKAGTFQGFPNQAQKQHTNKPIGKPVVWVPYRWARSINGVAYDNTNGKFGPFAGQFFLAELMFGGAIIRANVEQVNGVFQGACFPFWGKGLLGPVTLAFDPRGKLYVGGITEPGWMAMPDRGAVFRIDYTGQLPFEMQSIHVRPQGFQIRFTKPIQAATASKISAYRVESYRYEYTGSYGSPELDLKTHAIDKVTVTEDGLSVEVTVANLAKDRVYLISPVGIDSTEKESLVHPTGAYTLNEIPLK